MTSKEKIVCLLITYEAYANAFCDDNDIMKFNYDKANYTISKYDLEEVKEIIKDLEILEIVKPYVFKTCYGVKIENYFCEDVYKEKCKKLKEWLDGKD